MHIFNKVRPLRAFLKEKKEQQLSVGLVPTMGALHEGHLELIRASSKENEITVCSIFVNPLQFNSEPDLANYPRTIDEDKHVLLKSACDVLFAPSTEEMYTKPSEIKFDFGYLDKILEGKYRPGHFSGVGVVVSKLFNMIQPDRAYFGQKDFQQLKIVSKLVEELMFDLQLVSVPIVRDSDGLAKSSRNQLLTQEERSNAVILYQSLLIARQSLKQGKTIEMVRKEIKEKCEARPGVKLEYLEWVHAADLKQATSLAAQTVLLIAAFVGKVRLIDNLIVE